MTEERGKKVTNANGTEPGTDGTLVKYMFSGSPQDMFDFAPQAGEVRVMTVVAECTRDTGRRLTHDGKQLVAPWAIREVTLGRQTTLRDDDHDPGQTAIDDPDQQPDDGDENDTDDAEQAAIDNTRDPFYVAPADDAGDDGSSTEA